jgi:DNA polymerase-3 subunit epsilon
MRQVILDTETTGLEASAGHRIIEIGCMELINRRSTGQRFHRYLNPDRAVDEGAREVHGIDDDFLVQQPRFADVAAEFMQFLGDAQLVIHNADFDVGFINAELKAVAGLPADIREQCDVLDTLALARKMHPGQRNSLDALCKRYAVDNSRRELHGALLDAQILADVYLAMTGGQASLSLEGQQPTASAANQLLWAPIDRAALPLAVIKASPEEQTAHERVLAAMASKSGVPIAWGEAPSQSDSG